MPRIRGPFGTSIEISLEEIKTVGNALGKGLKKVQAKRRKAKAKVKKELAKMRKFLLHRRRKLLLYHLKKVNQHLKKRK